MHNYLVYHKMATPRMTYVHVQNLSIAFRSANRGRDNNQGVLRDEIADASLLGGGLVAWMRLDVEFQGLSQVDRE